MAEKIDVQGREISIISREYQDYISLTDIAKYRNSDAPADIVKNWLRSRSTIEFLGLWENLNNPGFKLVEFDQFKNEAGAAEADILNMALFGMTAGEWRDENPENKGNIRDYACVSQLVCLSNLENLNALFINESLPQKERLLKLNKIAIQQMKLLTDDRRVKKLGGKE